VKKLWEKPELVVLVRARPEESVLQACKIPGKALPGPYTGVNDYCKIEEGIPCTTCSQEAHT